MTTMLMRRALVIAGMLAAAGTAAQAAETSDWPTRAGEWTTMTNGVPNLVTTNSPFNDDGSIPATRMLGAAPATVTTYTYSYPVTTYTYTYPATVSYVAVPYVDSSRGSASATTNVPDRAGEFSTMTNGVPNLLTNNVPSAGEGLIPGNIPG